LKRHLACSRLPAESLSSPTSKLSQLVGLKAYRKAQPVRFRRLQRRKKRSRR
jgi:hypothetical protein